MGIQAVPLGLSDPTINHPVELWRAFHERLFQSRPGSLGPGQANLNKVGGALSLTVTKFGIIIPGTEADNTQGSYFVWSDADETMPWPGPSAQNRIDSLILRVVDNQYGTITGQARAEWEIVQGVPAGSPVARPDSDFNVGGSFYKPGAWLRVGNIQVNTTDTVELDTSRITKLIRHNPTGAGPFVFPTLADMTAQFGAYPEVYAGMLGIPQDRYGLYIRESSGTIRQVGGKLELAYSDQISSPTYGTAGSWVEFPEVNWPDFTFVAPESGKVSVNLFARLGNTASATATMRLGFSFSGGHTLAVDFPRAISGVGQKEFAMSGDFRVSGISPGATVTVKPFYRMSSGVNADVQLENGNIRIDALW